MPDASIPCQAVLTAAGSKTNVTVHTVGPAVVYVDDPYAKPSSVEHTITASGPASPTLTLNDNGVHAYTSLKIKVTVYSHRKANSCIAGPAKG